MRSIFAERPAGSAPGSLTQLRHLSGKPTTRPSGYVNSAALVASQRVPATARGHRLLFRDGPQSDGSIKASCRQGVHIRRDGDASNEVAVAFQQPLRNIGL